ncbi:MAG: leucine-rich repeat protein, partial [Clostridia bacterium]|nr:leucine-rich repeat protein [Clostridia bacterium]
FAGCSSMEELTLSSNISLIRYKAFEKCTSLTEVVIPGNVKTVEEYAFAGCDHLKTVDVQKGVEVLGQGVFTNCIRLETVTLNEGLTKLGLNYATDNAGVFEGCTMLQSISIPSSVIFLGQDSFMNCTALNEAYFYGAVPTTWGETVFKNNSDDFILYYIAGTDEKWTSPLWTAKDNNVYRTATFEPKIVYGDIDGDGEYNFSDAELFAAYFAGHDVTIQESTADLDKDNKITRRDAMILARYLYGWKGYTLPYSD